MISMEINLLLQSWWRQLVDWVDAFVAGLPQLIGAIVIFGLFWYLSKWVERLAKKLFDRIEAPETIEHLLATLSRIAIVLLGVMIALGVLDLDKTVTSMLAGLGIVGVALGFAFQDIAANFISGIILAIRRPFNIEDVIEVSGVMGVVQDIQLRSTIIKTFQGQIVHIPNQKVFGEIITNYSELGSQRIDLACGVSYDDDLEGVQYATLQAIKKLGYANDEPEPMLHFEEFGDSSINFVVRFWINYSIQPDFLEARSEAIKVITELYRDKGYTIPFPIRAVDLSQQSADKVLGR